MFCGRNTVIVEEEVELLDIKAEVLYGKLVEILGGNVDHAEVEYIIKLVSLILSLKITKKILN